MANRLVLVVAVCCATVIVLVAVFAHEAEPQPTCTCKAEACPAVPECPVPVACPPVDALAPTVEIRKPLSEELSAAKTRCEASLIPLRRTATEKLEAAYAALKVAKEAGVNSRDFAWLDDEKARTAAAVLLTAWQDENRAADAVFSSEMKCRDDMEALFHATEAWTWVDSAEMDEQLAGSRSFETAFVETVGYEYQNVWCNVGARRLECPMPRPQPVEATP